MFKKNKSVIFLLLFFLPLKAKTQLVFPLPGPICSSLSEGLSRCLFSPLPTLLTLLATRSGSDGCWTCDLHLWDPDRSEHLSLCPQSEDGEAGVMTAARFQLDARLLSV